MSFIKKHNVNQTGSLEAWLGDAGNPWLTEFSLAPYRLLSAARVRRQVF